LPDNEGLLDFELRRTSHTRSGIGRPSHPVEVRFPLSERVRIRRASVRRVNMWSPGVIAGSKELPLGVMSVPPCAERREGRPINADHVVGVMGLAACFVPRLARTTTVLGEPASPPRRGAERCAELAI